MVDSIHNRKIIRRSASERGELDLAYKILERESHIAPDFSEAQSQPDEIQVGLES